jgi:hypothetical protein
MWLCKRTGTVSFFLNGVGIIFRAPGKRSNAGADGYDLPATNGIEPG